MTRDLYVSTYGPALGTGRALRTYTCIRALALLGPVDLLYVPAEGDGPSPEYEAIEGLDFHRVVPSRGAGRAALYAALRARGVPDVAARATSPELVREAVRLAKAPGRGRIIAGDLASACALLPVARRRPFIHNSHNVVATSSGMGIDEQGREWRALQRFDERILRRAAETWVVSRADAAAASRVVPGARIRYAPNAVDVARIEPVPERPPSRRLLMVGDFTYAPNRGGRDFLVGEVLPRVWEHVPEARLRLAGRGLEDFAAPDPRVEAAGFVDDLGAEYAASDCVAVPLLEGGGSPLKFIEALAYGVPVAATPFAARGLEVVAGEHYVEGAGAPAFAAAVVGILRDGAPGVAAAARRLAETEYSVEALAERLRT